MTCLLQLNQNGRLRKQDDSGFLLLNVCLDNDPQGGSNRQSYELSRHAWEVSEFNRIQADKKKAEQELQDKEAEITALEDRRKSALGDQAMQAQLLAMIIEANRLEQERLALIALLDRFRREEDDLLAILYCLPFVL